MIELKELNPDIVDRLRCRYPLGPILENGQPEFGWRNFGGPINTTLPTPIMLDAADEIVRLRMIVSKLKGERR